MRPTRQQVGQRGEDLAVAELERRGMQVLARNWRCREGEIDIVAVEVVDGLHTLVFCEVKCRTGLGFGHPLESITAAKARRLRRLAGQWLAEHAEPYPRVRIDAVGVLLERDAAPSVIHVRGVDDR